MKRPLILLALLVWLLPGFVFAFPSGISLEQLVMDTWNDRSGLPSNSVLDVVQDKSGYIWIASYDGLVRFDGRSFRLFTKESASGFDSNSARVLLCDPEGTLWIGTNTDGLFALRDGVFTRYGKDQGLPDLSIRALSMDDFGKLWVSTAAGIAVSDAAGFRTVSPGEGISNFFLPLRDGSLLTGTSKKGLWKVTPRGMEAWLRQDETKDASFFAAAIDQGNRLWLGTGSGSILVFQGGALTLKLEPPELKGGTVKDFLSDADGTMWIATDKGLFYGRDGSFRLYSEANGLPNNAVTSLCQDREGSLWVGTERGGLVKFSPGKFVNITQREGLAGNSVNSVVEDAHGSLWVGSDQGLAFLPSAQDPWNTDKRRKALVGKVLQDLATVRIRQIRTDSQGGLWFATYSDLGLYHFDGEAVESFNQARGLPANRVRLSMQDHAGRLWIGTTAGLAMIDHGTLKIFGKADGLRNDFILDVHEDVQGRIWVGLDGGGLARLEKDGRFASWTTSDGLAGNVVFRIFHDREGRVWIATSDGLSFWTGDEVKVDWEKSGTAAAASASPGQADKKESPAPQAALASGPFRTWRAVNGLLSDSIYQILQENGSGKLWLVTSRGLAIVDPQVILEARDNLDKSRIRVLDRLDGLAGQPSANSWAWQSSQGVLYFPTIGGLSLFNPQSVNTNPNPPPVFLESISLDGQARPVPADGWKIPPGIQRLAFQFTALSFMVPQKVGFQYRLEGYDTAWQSPVNGERSAIYTNLSPGTYTFRVRAWNNDGVVNESGASASFSIEPRFTQTPWFLGLVAAGLVGLGFASNFIRTSAVRRRKEELERQVHERTDALNQEKQKSEALLLNILPVKVADELKANGKVQPQVHADVAVLFADLVNFTQKSAGLGPERTIDELNSIFSAFDTIVGRHGCERIKTIGDAYLAVSGLNDQRSPSERANALCRAGMEMLSFLKNRQQPDGLVWELRIGINTGPVVAGLVGIRKYIYDIFGDTVNTAFRMQAEANPGSIMLPKDTAKLLDDSTVLSCKGEAQIKGKGTMELYCVKPEEN